MSFKKVVATIILVGLFLILATYKSPEESPEFIDKYDPALSEQIKNAKTAFELKQYFRLWPDNIVYNEYPGAAEDFAMYFSLMDSDSYVVVDSGNEKYIIFSYVYSEYDELLTSINSIQKTYEKQYSCVLKVNIDYEITSIDCDGCYPNISEAYCILKLDEDIDMLLVNDYKYSRYDGGIIYVNQTYGVVNDNYDIIVPIQYSSISDLENFGTYSKYTTNEDGAGIMDKNYNVLIQPSYVNIEYVSDNRFIVQKDADGVMEVMNTFEDHQLYIIDEDENVLFGPIDGYLTYQNTFDNPFHQIIIGRMKDDKIYEGVIDDQLNVIIDTIYSDVVDFEISNNDCFYVVENENGETAVFDSLGKQQTEFENASIYETQTAYYKRIGR